MKGLLYIRGDEGDSQRQGTWIEYHKPWEGTDRGSKWPNPGSFGREKESELAGHGFGKKWESPRERQHWPNRERLVEPEEESSECCWELSPKCPARMLPSPPTPSGHTHKHTHTVALILLQVRGFWAASHQLGFFLSLLPLESQLKKGDGWMLKLVIELWLSLFIPRLSHFHPSILIFWTNTQAQYPTHWC